MRLRKLKLPSRHIHVKLNDQLPRNKSQALHPEIYNKSSGIWVTQTNLHGARNMY